MNVAWEEQEGNIHPFGHPAGGGWSARPGSRLSARVSKGTTPAVGVVTRTILLVDYDEALQEVLTGALTVACT